MKVLVTGCRGQLGQEVLWQLRENRIFCAGVDMADFDLADVDKLRAYMRRYRPDAVIHCAAFTDAEEAEHMAARCCLVNGMGTMNIARCCRELGSRLLYVSCDRVFTPWGDTLRQAHERPSPKTVLGLSKLQGEEAVKSMLTDYFIVRTSWLYSAHGENLVTAIRQRAATHTEITVANDRLGAPTYARDLAALLVRMVQTDKYGIYHATGGGECTLLQFAQAVVRMSQLVCRVRPLPAAQAMSAERLSERVRLDNSRLTEAGFAPLPTWQDGLKRCLTEIVSGGDSGTGT